jgi:alpha/beta superfamily hydrolase
MAVIEKVKTQKGIQIEHAVVDGANHFFDGRVEQLMEQVSVYLDRKVGPETLKSEQEQP